MQKVQAGNSFTLVVSVSILKGIIVFKVLSMAALVCLAPITKYHRLSGLRTAENYCSWFWRIEG